MLRASCLSHFFDNCVTPDMTSKKKKKTPSLTEFWKVSDDKPGYFFKWPYIECIETERLQAEIKTEWENI